MNPALEKLIRKSLVKGWVNRLGLTVWLFLPAKDALACSVCFGDPHSKISHGVFAAVYLLLGLVIFVLGGIAGTAFTWARRAKNISNSQSGGPGSC